MLRPIIILSLLCRHATAQLSSSSSSSSSPRPATSTTSSTTTASSATSSTSSSTSSSSRSTTSVSATSTAAQIQFDAIPTLTACGSGRLQWTVVGTDASDINLKLYAANIGVDQSTSSSTSTSISTTSTSSSISSSSISSSTTTTTSRSTTTTSASTSTSTSAAIVSRFSPDFDTEAHLAKRGNINLTITTNTPANADYTWSPIKLPAGRYYIFAIGDDKPSSNGKSGIFTVVAGTNMTCLQSTASSTTSSSARGNVSASAGSAGSESASISSGVSGGAIAGIVIGVLAVIAGAIIALFFLRRRRRQRQGRQFGFGADAGHYPPDMRQGAFDVLPSATASQFQDQHGRSTGGGGPGNAAYAMGQIRRDSDDKILLDGGSGSDGHGAGMSEESYSTPLFFKDNAQRHQGSGQGYPNDALAPSAGPSTPQVGSHSTSNPFSTPSQVRSVPISHSASGEEIMADEPSEVNAGRGDPGNTSSAAMSAASSADRTRTISGAGAKRGSTDAGGGDVAMGRSTSLRRKPVPSLGDELRGQMKREEDRRKGSSGGGGVGADVRRPSGPGMTGNGDGQRRSYNLDVDVPGR